MLFFAIRNDKHCSILSRPQLLLTDNHMGTFQVSGSTQDLTARLTPQIANDGGSVTLRFESQLKKPAAGTQTSETRSLYVTETIPNEGTLVARGMRSKTADGGAKEVFILATVVRLSQSTPNSK